MNSPLASQTPYVRFSKGPQRYTLFLSLQIISQLFCKKYCKKRHLSNSTATGKGKTNVNQKKPQAQKASYYKVRQGDTLSKIAARNGTTVKKLCQLNGLKSNSPLKIGRQIRVK